jgi:archaemetzincin
MMNCRKTKNVSLLLMAFYVLIPVKILAKKENGSAKILRKQRDKLRSIHQILAKPRPGDWLYRQKELGQTFEDYLKCHPVLPQGKRHVIYIQPLGGFTSTQRQIISLTEEFLRLYFNLPVKTRVNLPLSLIPDHARRFHPSWGVKQISSLHILHSILKPRLPEDAAAYIALTSIDLWPGPGWNFVFGQASIFERVGVWSLFRNGNPEKSDKEFKLTLLRTLKTASHEIGHMFSMLHCIHYECNMCGSNNRQESDRHPIILCPECMAKLCWATKTDALERYKKLADFFKKNGFTYEAEFCLKSIQTIKEKP